MMMAPSWVKLQELPQKATMEIRQERWMELQHELHIGAQIDLSLVQLNRQNHYTCTLNEGWRSMAPAAMRGLRDWMRKRCRRGSRTFDSAP